MGNNGLFILDMMKNHYIIVLNEVLGSFDRMNKFYESNFEEAVIELFKEQGYDYEFGSDIHRLITDTILVDDLYQALFMINYEQGIREEEIEEIIRKLTAFNTTNLYEINSLVHSMILNGIRIERNDEDEEDFVAKIIDFDNVDNNIFKLVNQYELMDFDQVRIPDLVVFVNGLPLVVFELKNVTDDKTTIIYN